MKNNIEHTYVENSPILLSNTSPVLKYLKKQFSNTLIYNEFDTNTLINTRNRIGIITYNDETYRIYSKISDLINVLRILEKISSCKYKFREQKKYITFDVSQKIRIEQGINVVGEIVNIFLAEVRRVRYIGLSKCYRQHNESIMYLRGKLNTSKQSTKNIINNKFWCKYNTLEFRTPENIMLYKAIVKLLTSNYITREQYAKLLSEKKELEQILGNDILKEYNSRIQYKKTRVNTHYELLIKLCEMILNNNFYSSLKDGNNIFCNFIACTDIIFERYIFILVKEVIEEYFETYFVEEQVEISNIRKIHKSGKNKEGVLNMQADIIVYHKEKKQPVLIIDTKYIDLTGKTKLTNSAYFQMCTYLINMFSGYSDITQINGILLAQGQNAGNHYEYTNLKGINFKIYTENINILDDEEKIKEDIYEMLKNNL